VIQAICQAPSNVEAALVVETDVEEHELGMKRLGESHRLVARTSDSHHRDPFVLEQTARLFAEARTIVDNQAAK